MRGRRRTEVRLIDDNNICRRHASERDRRQRARTRRMVQTVCGSDNDVDRSSSRSRAERL